MDREQLRSIVEAAWEDRASIGLDTKGEVRDAVERERSSLLDTGKLRVAEKMRARTGRHPGRSTSG